MMVMPTSRQEAENKMHFHNANSRALVPMDEGVAISSASSRSLLGRGWYFAML